MTDLHTAVKQDIPDLIAGELGVSRGTAYDLMREALEEQPERPYRQLQDNGSKYFGESWDKAEQPAQGCDHCNHPLYVGTKCKNCGRVTEQAAQQEPVAIALNTGTKQGVKWLKNVEHGEHLYTSPQPAQQEPLVTKTEKGIVLHVGWDDLPVGAKLYTSPQPAQRKPLSAGNMPPEVDEMRKAALELGDWLSAALDDKYVCLEYKQAINNWFNCAMPYPPAQRTWVGLTDEECVEIAARGYPRWLEFAHAIEAKLREKNA